MITIALDESGRFEQRSKVILVGGLVFTGDYEQEKQNIEKFLIEQCNKLHLRYPKDIHANDGKSTSEIKRKVTILNRQVKDYLQNSGKYHFIFILKSRQEREDYRNISNVVNDHTASNLYEHMITQLLNNFLFYNTYFKDEQDIVLEIASRTIPVPGYQSEAIENYKQLGYRYNYGDRTDKYWFYLTDQATFKNALSLKMMESRIKREIELTFNVSSINYHRTKNDEDRNTTPFLYLADFACDIIRETINPIDADFGLERFYLNAKELTGNDLIFWAYDDIDHLWNQLFTSFEENDFMKCLELTYDLRNKASDFNYYYDQHWLQKLENKFIDVFNPEQIGIYVNQLQYLLRKENRALTENGHNVTKAIFIGRRLELTIVLWEDKTGKRVNEKAKYQLADSMLMAYNHRGDIKNAFAQFEQCKKLRNNISPEDYFGTTLSVAQMHANSFDYMGAIEFLKKSEYYLQIYKDLNQEIASDVGQEGEALKYALLGKVKSSFGQFYSFLREKETAVKYFEEALEEFYPQSADQQMTTSFILHLALEMNDRTLYDRYVADYLGSRNVFEQFDFIQKTKDSYRYFAYIKSLNVFYSTENKVIKKRLTKNVKWIVSQQGVNGHPWELIYKHAAIWLYHYFGDKTIIENQIEKINQVITIPANEMTIKVLNLGNTILLRSLYEKDLSKLKQMVEEFKKEITSLESINQYFIEIHEKSNIEDCIKMIRDKFTFTYC